MTENDIGTIVVATAIHVTLGARTGVESVYEAVLAFELKERGLQVDRQVPVTINYRGLKFDEAFRADIIVERRVLIELKCVEKLNNTHKKQLLTYLRLTGAKLGYLLNFGEAVMKDGIVRMVNGLPADP